mmetsp:Transcript_17835/g.47968  ORF Transcript_17835/g.47968 Transcript_17835/m.47968 type:complete len:237 (+) Transcript_17835:206-916(+)
MSPCSSPMTRRVAHPTCSPRPPRSTRCLARHSDPWCSACARRTRTTTGGPRCCVRRCLCLWAKRRPSRGSRPSSASTTTSATPCAGVPTPRPSFSTRRARLARPWTSSATLNCASGTCSFPSPRQLQTRPGCWVWRGQLPLTSCAWAPSPRGTWPTRPRCTCAQGIPCGSRPCTLPPSPLQSPCTPLHRSSSSSRASRRCSSLRGCSTSPSSCLSTTSCASSSGSPRPTRSPHVVW